ncbi:DUF3619 family protein [Rhodoferax saidenbachensis]|uniref:DUF3619 domain-containing protein n=1 Tax=Rhodoferax saidenbachensis TaxID=1484693 RepID=A0ABU1ZSI7_9BURK|nr:DUF3619 family protein [Rhodoferax saidenbachensis]MDR7308517.1 hypothetical protein [Rhodoferax saidenbachensis]
MTSKSHTTNRPFSQDTLGRAITARLSETTQDLPHDITQRLKAARMLALEKRKVVKLSVATGVAAAGGNAAVMHLGDAPRGKWRQLGAWLPLLALVAGLLTIGFVQDDYRAREIADVDAEILTDDLPPAAFTDPGFAQFLRVNRGE